MDPHWLQKHHSNHRCVVGYFHSCLCAHAASRAMSSGGAQVRCGCHCPWGEGAGPGQMATRLLGPGGNVGVLSHFHPLCFLLLYPHSSPQQHLKCNSGHPIPQPVNPSHPVRFCSEETTYCPKVLTLLDRTLRPVQQMRLGGDNNDVVRLL